MVQIRNDKKRRTTNTMQQLTTNLHNAIGRPHEEGPHPTNASGRPPWRIKKT